MHLLALLNKLNPRIQDIQALIIVPSRELAQQIEQVFKSLTTKIKISCFYGGHHYKLEANTLKEPPIILVGTPGRLTDHFKNSSLTDLKGTLGNSVAMLHDEIASRNLGINFNSAYQYASLEDFADKVLNEKKEILKNI